MPFALFIVASYALTRQDATVDRWIHFHGVKINLGGATVGLLMVVRVLAVVMASQVARAGDPRAVAHGLGKLGMPRIAAVSIDAVLALLGGNVGGTAAAAAEEAAVVEAEVVAAVAAAAGAKNRWAASSPA